MHIILTFRYEWRSGRDIALPLFVCALISRRNVCSKESIIMEHWRKVDPTLSLSHFKEKRGDEGLSQRRHAADIHSPSPSLFRTSKPRATPLAFRRPSISLQIQSLDVGDESVLRLNRLCENRISSFLVRYLPQNKNNARGTRLR